MVVRRVFADVVLAPLEPSLVDRYRTVQETS